MQLAFDSNIIIFINSQTEWDRGLKQWLHMSNYLPQESGDPIRIKALITKYHWTQSTHLESNVTIRENVRVLMKSLYAC